jgi:hypothetical protein
VGKLTGTLATEASGGALRSRSVRMRMASGMTRRSVGKSMKYMYANRSDRLCMNSSLPLGGDRNGGR